MTSRSPILRIALAALLVGPLWTVSQEAGAYRFVCNSVDATGVPSGDLYGPCSEASAARWPEATLGLTWFSEGRPETVSDSQMEEALAGAARTWNDVVGCRFRVQTGKAAAESAPAWGSVDDRHHLQWVSGPPDAWQELTFTNPETTVALTAVRYFCDTEELPRTIFDADIALNNTGPAWQCPEPDCWRLEHALTHELGHALGLGHACGACDTLVMVAKADPAFQPDSLFDDDRNGCRALYPESPVPEPIPEPEPESETFNNDMAAATEFGCATTCESEQDGACRRKK